MAQSQGHHTIDHLEDRGRERVSCRQPVLKARERAFVIQTNAGTSKGSIRYKSRKTRHSAFPQTVCQGHGCHLQLKRRMGQGDSGQGDSGQVDSGQGDSGQGDSGQGSKPAG